MIRQVEQTNKQTEKKRRQRDKIKYRNKKKKKFYTEQKKKSENILSLNSIWLKLRTLGF